MQKVGGYMCVKLVNNGTKKVFKKAAITDPQAVYMFVAGGKKIDKKVELANQKLLTSNTVVNQNKPQKTDLLSVVKQYIRKIF